MRADYFFVVEAYFSTSASVASGVATDFVSNAAVFPCSVRENALSIQALKQPAEKLKWIGSGERGWATFRSDAPTLEPMVCKEAVSEQLH